MSDDNWDDYAEGWDSNPAAITYAQQAFQSLGEAIDYSGARILDFGCGTGLLTERLSAQSGAIVALDPSAKMLSVLAGKQLPNVDTIHSELTRKLIERNTHLQTPFDLIVASSALAFVPEYPQTLLLLRQLLKKGGTLVQWDWLKPAGDNGIGFTPEDIAGGFSDAGLAVVQVNQAFALDTGDERREVVMGIATNTR
ncbi:ubiquinone biosynthesis O-methyltransferase, mitochondrial [Microbulbifer aestuariivivens]|uniref:Ubiquinone biosynthesis O-methyltransferase, mitochondrial n=1 Tax=Microbulbifer aestuariivivens TaxID=1908308 RepID=A0ABP9WNN2_9GAMM